MRCEYYCSARGGAQTWQSRTCDPKSRIRIESYRSWISPVVAMLKNVVRGERVDSCYLYVVQMLKNMSGVLE